MLVDQRRSHPASPGRLRVTVLGQFLVTRDGTPVPLGSDAGRVVAYLAVHRHPQSRTALAADLWPGLTAALARHLLDEALASVEAIAAASDGRLPDAIPSRAGARRDAPAAGLLDTGPLLALQPAVTVDLDDAMALVRELAAAPGRAPAGPLRGAELLKADILPGWTAAWLAVERERFRQIRLNALEELSGVLSAHDRHDEAVALAEEAVRAAPSRESARRVLIEAHLAQGEIAEAVAQYDEYQELLRSSVGAPSAFGLDGLLPPAPAWPVLRVRRPMQGLAPSRTVPRSGRPRRLVAGGSTPGTTR